MKRRKNEGSLIGNVVGPVDHWWYLQIREHFVVVFIQGGVYLWMVLTFVIVVIDFVFIVIVINSITATVVMILVLSLIS